MSTRRRPGGCSHPFLRFRLLRRVADTPDLADELEAALARMAAPNMQLPSEPRGSDLLWSLRERERGYPEHDDEDSADDWKR